LECRKGTGVTIVKLHFIINERAGNGKGSRVWDSFKKELNSPFSYHKTDYKAHGSVIAKEIAKNAQSLDEACLIVAIGGDGTIHEVVNGIANCQNVIVGAISAGSGNDFARYFRTFNTAKEIDQFVQENQSSSISYDCGTVEWDKEDIRFVNNSGIGFDAYVAASANLSSLKKQLNKIGLGKLSYMYYVLRGLFTFALFDIIVELNGKQQKYENVWFVTVSNQPYFGGGMKISPRSIPNDGLLELSIVHNLSRLKLLVVFASVFFGKHTKIKEFVQIEGEQFTLYIQDELLCHADGEILGVTKMNSTLQYNVQVNSWKMINK